MAILGIITDLGLSTSQDAANDEGFNLVPVSFGVSDVAGVLDPTRTTPNAGQFYTNAISSRVIIDQNTIKFLLTIPPNQIPTGTFKIIREIYLNINDNLAVPFLFAIGQPTDEIRYNADDQVTLELEMAITNLDLTANFTFAFTQSTEISDHNTNPASHTEIITALKKAGIFLTAGAFPVERRGQHYENNKGLGVEFDGTKATVLYNGLNFTATFNGTELNGKQLIFDGALTADEVRANFNALNYPDTVEHDGIGTEVLAAGTPSLVTGTYIVQDGDVVYKDVDEVYKQAIADGTIKSKIAGIAFLDDKCVSTHGLIDLNTGFPIGTSLYLSGTTAGAVVNFDTNVNAGLALGDFIYFIGYTGDISANVSQEFDAVVTNQTGVGQFLTTQGAIDFVPSDGRILVNKIEDVKTTINTAGKNLTIEVNGPDKGWRKFAGAVATFSVEFDAVPTQGTFRIEWDGQETIDLPFNASNLDVQTEFNLLSGHNGFTVTGDFTVGFTFTSNDNDNYPLPTFVFSGINEIQRFDFGNIPDDGTFTIEHLAQQTLNFPWDDLASDLKIALELLPNISSVDVTGEFASNFFQVEFTGTFLENGVQEYPLMEVIASDLDLLGAVTSINGVTTIPVNAVAVQKGIKPASNLFNGTTPIVITTTSISIGEPVGPDTLMNIDSTNLKIGGLGRVQDFVNGFIMEATSDDIVIEAHFPNTTFPVETLDKIPGLDYSFDDIQGYAKDTSSQLRITQHPTNPKRVIISGADQLYASGIISSQELNSVPMDFAGAEVDFSTSPIEVYEPNGVTLLNADVVMPTIAPDQWRWFTLNLVRQSFNADGSAKAEVLIVPALTDGATKELAEKAGFDAKPIGEIAIQGALGDKEKTQIVTTKDTFGSLVGKAFTLTSKLSPAPANNESVAFWFTDPSLDTPQIEDGTNVVGVDLEAFNATDRKGLAGKIVVGGLITIDKIHLYLSKIGNPTGSVSVRILGESGGFPDVGNILANGVAPVQMADVPTDFTNPVVVDLGGDVVLTAGTYYVDVDGLLYVFSGGNLLQWNAQAGIGVEIFNRDPVGAVWLSDLGARRAHFDLVHTIKGYPTIASAADREVEITTLAENDLQAVVATKVQTTINNDGAFNATVTTNKIVVENAILGAVPDIDEGDSGFFGTVLVQGTDTDATGIEDLQNTNVRQLGVGSGGGGAVGGGTGIEGYWQRALSADLTLDGEIASLGITGLTVGNKYEVIINVRAIRQAESKNELQELTFSNIPTYGLFQIEWDGETTYPLPYDATAGDIQTAMDGLANTVAGDVLVSGAFPTFTLEFAFNYAVTNVPEITIPSNTLVTGGTVGTNEVQDIVFTDTPTSGTFTISFTDPYWGVQETGLIQWDATPTDVKNALELLPSINGVTVTAI